jgi:tetratricopeptide (TPR) repeat protein
VAKNQILPTDLVEDRQTPGVFRDPNAEFTVIQAETVAQALEHLNIHETTQFGQIIDCSAELDRHRDLTGRLWLKQQVQSWIDRHEFGYLLLDGGPGFGKSAFVAQWVRSSNLPLAYHFIKRNMGNWDQPEAILRSLTAQLRCIYAIVQSEADQQVEPTTAFVNVLSQVSRSLGDGQKAILFLDGLDEVNVSLPFLPTLLPKGIYMVLTSRNSEHLTHLGNPTSCHRLYLDPTDPANLNDIRYYLQRQNRSRWLKLDDAFIETLAEASEGFFIAAVLYVRKRRDLNEELKAWKQNPSKIPQGIECINVSVSRSTVPEHNRNFVGRVEDLRRLRQMLEQNPIGVIAAVHGIAGIGKTELAFNYAYHHAHLYPGGCYYVACEGVSDLRSALVRLADQGGAKIRLTDSDRQNLHRAASRVVNELLKRGRCLIVLDNVDQADLLCPAHCNEVLPNRKLIHLLVTTRLAPASLREMECLALDALPTDDAVRLLERHRLLKSEKEYVAAVRIVNHLGGHALACEVVAIYLQDNPQVSCVSYLQMLEKEVLLALHFAGQHEDEITGESYHAQLKRHTQPLIGALLKPTLDKLTLPLRLVVNHTALLAPDAIPLPWLEEIVRKALGQQMTAVVGQADPWQRLLDRLTGLRLLTKTEDCRIVRMHRLLQAVVIEGMPSEQKEAYEEALLEKASCRARVYENSVVPQDCVWEMRMLGQLANHWLVRKTAKIAQLACAVAMSLRSLGDMSTTRSLLTAGHEILAVIAGENPDDLFAQRNFAYSMIYMGDLSLREGKAEEARQYFQKSLDIRQRLAQTLPNSVHIQRDLAGSLNRMGELSMQEGKAEDAGRYFKKSLEIDEHLSQVLPDDVNIQRDWIASLICMGNLLLREYKTISARVYFQKSLEIAECLAHVLPDDVCAQRALMASLNGMGELSMQERNAEDAQLCFKKSLEIDEHLAQALPDDLDIQRDWAVSLGRMGYLSVQEGKTEEARRYYQQSLEIIQRLGQAFPDDMQFQSNWSAALRRMGSLSRREGKAEEARWYFQQTLEIRHRLAQALPDDVYAQRECAESLYEMGDLSLRENKPEEAQWYFQQSLEISQRLAKVLPNQFDAQYDLAVLQSKLGELAAKLDDKPVALLHFSACHQQLLVMQHHGLLPPAQFLQRVLAVMQSLRKEVGPDLL